MTPTNSGGAVASWSISPSLPGGLAFDTSTGIISGAPSTSQGQTVFTITATNAGGAVTTTVTLTIDVRRTSSGIVPVVPVVPVVPKPEVNPGTLSQYTKAPVAAGSKPINGSIKTVGNRPGRTPVANATPSTPIRVNQEIQDALALRALVESKAGEISITPLNGWTGRMSIPIVKIINNQEVEVFIDLEVLPGEPTGGEYKLNTIQETQINWQASVSQIVKYQVELNNRVICEVTTTTCTVRNPIGPNSSIKVTAIGNDNHLIDIGSGYGGDISKTNKYSRILAIEPDAEHMEEFRRRLALFSPEKQRQISTLIAGGEEYEKIMTAVRHTFGNEFGKKPLYISMMLSMTFFWKSEEMLQQLANTINLIKEEYYKSVPKDLKTSSGPKNTVKFLFLVMDGERVVKYLKEHDDSVNLNGALINYKDILCSNFIIRQTNML
jgi:hypothetical protein